MGMIHVLMLSRAIEAQVTIEELCDVVRQVADEETPDERWPRAVVPARELVESRERRSIPRVDFW